MVAVAADFGEFGGRGWGAEGLAKVGFGDDGVDGARPGVGHGIALGDFMVCMRDVELGGEPGKVFL